jgi:ubiquinone/menaquinone biosynthesis C-methylase UbiE
VDDWRSYDGIAETYERVDAPHTAEVSPDLVALAAPPTGGRALDVGTGTGVTAIAAIAAMGPGSLVVGVDASIEMLRAGANARPGLRAAAEAIDLPFRDGTFDLVTASFVLHHFAKVETALFDLVRVLRPGGRLALSTWADGGDELTSTWHELIEEVVPHEILGSTMDQVVPGRDRFRTRGPVEEALIEAGLTHVRTEPTQYRFTYTIAEYVDSAAIGSAGRFARDMLGDEALWRSFVDRAKATFAERFADPLNDFHDVILAVATKP